jgi:hypothetical protein
MDPVLLGIAVSIVVAMASAIVHLYSKDAKGSARCEETNSLLMKEVKETKDMVIENSREDAKKANERTAFITQVLQETQQTTRIAAKELRYIRINTPRDQTDSFEDKDLTPPSNERDKK